MGIATHLGPWLLGTVRNTTGTTSGTIRNTGPTAVYQTRKINYANVATGTAATIMTLPAGAHILNIFVDTLTTLSGGGITAATLTLGTSATADLFFPATTILTAGRQSPTLTTTQVTAYAGAASTAAPDGIGIGPTDVLVVATPTFTTGNPTAGVVQITIGYLVANPDGTFYPTSQTGP